MNNKLVPYGMLTFCKNCGEQNPYAVKELTDFEIKGVLGLDECWIGEDSSMPNMIAFARAILRKAQE
jgi:hypothetical protein